ncbi:MAG TPA: hypothetical protein VKA64_01255 [Gammaproteobacteria bacterium]|nr:hypothetical protein [Gammaproteobacteria bacterium]
MGGIIGRDYCIRHPMQVIHLFGAGVLLGMLWSERKSLLERVIEYHQDHGIPLPGEAGRAYRLAALIEFRVAHLYQRLAEQFADQPEVQAFYRELQAEELEHGRLMCLCRYTGHDHPALQYRPSLRDPEVSETLRRVRSLEKAAPTLTLNEALAVTEALEQTEINTIFDRLLRQADSAESRLFEEQLQATADHATEVPRRIAALREQLADAAA